MNAIKSKRERIDEWTVHHVFEGTKYLDKCYAVKSGSCYYVKDYASDSIIYGLGKYTWVRSLKEVKEWIAAYDENFLEEWAAEVAEAAEERARWEAYRVAVAAGNEIMTFEVDPSVVEANKAVVGDRIVARFAKCNKNSSIGEYIHYCSEEDGFNDEPFAISKVVELTNEEYDNFVLNLLDGYEFLGENVGGSWSDAAEELGISPDDFGRSFGLLSNEDREKWYEGGYRVGALVKAPSRFPVAVDPSGYKYARYVGLVK